MIVTIDGPAASGKSTTAHAVAQAVGFVHVDAGVMYRTAALALIRAGVDAESASSQQVKEVLGGMDIRFSSRGGEARVGTDDVTAALRTGEITSYSSRVGSVESVRAEIIALQRQAAVELVGLHGGVVFSGREMGIHVFPDACVKVFVVASFDSRVERRWRETPGADKALVAKDIRARDARHWNRRPGEPDFPCDGLLINTDTVPFKRQVEIIVGAVKAVFAP